MSRVCVVLGTRPEAIKLAPVVPALTDVGLEPLVVSTGQHQEMLDQVLDLFAITTARDLAVMEPDQSLAGLTARLLEAVDGALGELTPDAVVVQGDTNTSFASALVAFYRGIPVAHVEAGLRTGDLQRPFPEEGNRILVTRLAALHFAPTETNRRHLLREGVDAKRVFVTGNTVIDALRIEVERQQAPGVARQLEKHLTGLLGLSAPLRGPYVLVTGHRRESFGEGFRQICVALSELAERHPDHDFVYPVHLNPKVQKPVRRALSGLRNVHLIHPLDYRNFVALMKGARLVLTDSGGVQEEAPYFGIPVLVMRETTERPEGVDAGTVRLVGADTGRIVAGVSKLLRDPAAHAEMARAVNPYGDGHAAPRIAKQLRTLCGPTVPVETKR